MLIVKGYVVADGELFETVCLDESDRNEIALSLFQEGVYERFMLEYNWYGDSFESDFCECGFKTIEELWADRLKSAIFDTNENIFAYETTVVMGG